jgi:hypothetical protein
MNRLLSVLDAVRYFLMAFVVSPFFIIKHVEIYLMGYSEHAVAVVIWVFLLVYFILKIHKLLSNPLTLQ